MSRSRTIRIDQVGEFLHVTDANIRRCVEQAARAAAHRLKAHLVAETSRLGVVDMGIYKNSFVVRDKTVTNEAPHAGIIELGARPHKVSLQGVIAIAEWVVRKLRLRKERTTAQRSRSKDPTKTHSMRRLKWPEAMKIAWAIAKKIEREGQKPRHIMRDALPQARAFFHHELTRRLEKTEMSHRTGGGR